MNEKKTPSLKLIVSAAVFVVSLLLIGPVSGALSAKLGTAVDWSIPLRLLAMVSGLVALAEVLRIFFRRWSPKSQRGRTAFTLANSALRYILGLVGLLWALAIVGLDVQALLAGGLIGIFIAAHATFAAEVGGCQAECGSASGMTAGALVQLLHGSVKMAVDAASMALQNTFGMTCDPVAGLVEIPCIKRNVSGIMIAFSSADMVLAGIRAYIPADECIGAMQSVGDMMNSALKETAAGGLAATPTGRKLKEKVFGAEE